MKSTSFQTTLQRDGNLCIIPVPIDPKPVFGKARAPVKVTLNGYTFRSTIAVYGGDRLLPLRRSNREAAGLEGNETLQVTLTLDEDERKVELPKDLAKALRAEKLADAFRAASYSHQREYVEAIEGANKPETRARRIEGALQFAREREKAQKEKAKKAARPAPRKAQR